jgi:hypothetical protein
MTLNQMMQVASERQLTVDEVDEYCRHSGESVDEFCDRLSRKVAVEYDSGNLEFNFCDVLMNNLFGFMVSHQHRPPPDFAFAIFLAFDSGEFYPPGVSREASLEDLYTRPMIKDVLARTP